MADVDDVLELLGPGRYILIAGKNAGPMVLRIGANDRVGTFQGYGERVELQLEGLSALVDGIDRFRMEADASGIERFRVDPN